MAGSLDLPVVNVASSDLHAVAKSMRQACLERVFAESKKFFELPMEEKMALKRNNNHRGYTPHCSEKLDASSKFLG